MHIVPPPPAPTPEAERQACDSQSQKARGFCNLGHRDGTSTKLGADSQLLTTSFWNPGWLTPARSVTA